MGMDKPTVFVVEARERGDEIYVRWTMTEPSKLRKPRFLGKNPGTSNEGETVLKKKNSGFKQLVHAFVLQQMDLYGYDPEKSRVIKEDVRHDEGLSTRIEMLLYRRERKKKGKRTQWPPRID